MAASFSVASPGRGHEVAAVLYLLISTLAAIGSVLLVAMVWKRHRRTNIEMFESKSHEGLRIDEDRVLSPPETNLVRWLLEQGGPTVQAHITELVRLRVVSRCGCGCASIDFACKPGVGLEVLVEYQWEDEAGHLFGIFVFAKEGVLAGLEVYSIDGQVTPSRLPNVELLRPIV